MAKQKTDENGQIKSDIREYLLGSWQEMMADIDSLEPKERVDRKFKLLEYIMPKVQAVRVEETKSATTVEAMLGMESAYEDEDNELQ